LLRDIAAEARRLGVGLHIHAAQSAREVEAVERMYGRSPLEHLAALEVMGPNTVLAHLTFASAADLDAVRATGARYAHCPTIYPRRGVYPDLPGIRARGIPTGFAPDRMMNDPFEGMRNALNALRLRSGRVEALTTAEALWFATAGSARVLGLDQEIGTLEVGKKADLIVIDLERPHLQPFYADAASLVYYARASDVVTSIVDGRVIMEDRRIVGLDEPTILAKARRHLPRFSALLLRLGGISRLGDCPCGAH
jgi:5-methylthioadenosine/S-adenosylhomocysteine deaminase